MKTEDELTKLNAIMNQTEFEIDSEYKIPKVFNCPICGEELELFNGKVFITKSNGGYYKGKVCTKCNYEFRFRIKEWMYRKIDNEWKEEDEEEEAK